MSSPRNTKYALHISWHHLTVFSLASSILIGIGRSVFYDLDNSHCSSVASSGSWLDNSFKTWQPDGCMLHAYTPADSSACLTSASLTFVGDSLTRKLFFQLAHLIDPKLPTAPLNPDSKHANHSLITENGAQLSFFWDPFLNTTNVHALPSPSHHSPNTSPRHPGLLVLGSGLWYLRYVNESGGLPAWEANIGHVLDTLQRSRDDLPEGIYVLPVGQVVPSKLESKRAASMHVSDVDAMNADLHHRVATLALTLQHHRPIRLLEVFNDMLDASLTEDGLHYADSLVRAQANILLNLHCNDLAPKRFPLSKTCCFHYPWPSFPQLAFLAFFPILGLIGLHGRRFHNAVAEETRPHLLLGAVLLFVFIADRSNLWIKEHKYFDPITFAFLNVVALAIGVATVKQADKDLGFLNRDQTDEWKGWMQIAILIYHYLGASKVSGIYNPIRVLVAAYLFMTGYGHTMFYVRKADFGFLRVAQVLVRLNLLTVVLAYVMNTDYISYYFAPLVSLWFLIIYATMAVASRHNDRVVVLLVKIAISCGLVTWFMSEPWPLEWLFQGFRRVFGIEWSAREWAFRFKLDLWVVYAGMLTALVVMRMQKASITSHPQWLSAVKIATVVSFAIIVWFFAFELGQASKFTYNVWHPYISPLPVMAFAILRNCTPRLRSLHSRAFAFIGKCSLETFILQYHIWLAGDTKGVLLLIPTTRLRPINLLISTLIFIYISHLVAQVTGQLTNQICNTGTTLTPLPTTNQRINPVSFGAQREEESIALMQADSTTLEHGASVNEGSPPNTNPFVKNLAFNVADWTFTLPMRLALIFGVLWVCNLIWPKSA